MQCGVVFSLDERQFALPLDATARVVRAVDITPLPQAHPGIPGVIDVHGEVMPVVDLRARFGLPPRALVPAAQFVLVNVATRSLALWVDEVSGVASWPESDFVEAEPFLPGGHRLRGIARGPDGLVLVHDLDALLAEVVAVADEVHGGE